MRATVAPVCLALAMIPSLVVGCKHAPIMGADRTQPPPPTDRKADAPSLVNYLNQNAQRVQNFRAQVDIDCKASGRSVGLGGKLACQKPRNFRLQADVLGKPAVDIGSNNEEFWYWISQDRPPYVYHCAYSDLSSGKVRVPFPFHPDMVVAAMGIAEYDPGAKYDLKETDKTLELIQESTSTDGQPVRRITVFNRRLAAPGQPQVLAHKLTDASGKLICQATVSRVSVDRATNAVLPREVTIEWPAQELKMKMMISGTETNVVDEAVAGRVFSRAALTMESFDLARRSLDSPSSIRRAGASTVLPKR